MPGFDRGDEDAYSIGERQGRKRVGPRMTHGKAKTLGTEFRPVTVRAWVLGGGE